MATRDPKERTRRGSMPTVFISYSHKDESWKNRLVTHLGVLQQQGLLDVWVDRKIGAGEDWYAQIQAAMRRAKVAVLIVTADFLNSRFILSEEVPQLLLRRKKSGMRVIPIIAKPCAWDAVDWLKRMQLRPTDAKPLSTMRRPEADQHLTDIAREILAVLRGDIAAPASSRRVGAVQPVQGGGRRTRSSATVTGVVPARPAVKRPTAGQPKTQSTKTAAGSAVRSSGHWVLLDDNCYVSASVNEGDDSITMRIPVAASAEDATLRQLKANFSRSHEAFSWAYQNDAALVTLTLAERESQGEKSAWLLTVRRSDHHGNALWSEMSYNSISADEIAEMRARLLLLNERPDRRQTQNDPFFESVLRGTAGQLEVTGGIFPQLWTARRGNAEAFLRQARLRAVYALKLSQICEHIEELTLGPIRNNRLPVKFRGVRGQRYANEAPVRITVTGLCPLKG